MPSRWFPCALSLALLVGCSPSFRVAEHTPLPQIDRHEGVILSAPALVTITFPGYEHQGAAEALANYLGGSSWLHTVGAEYGVVGASARTNLVWPTNAPGMLTDLGLRAFLAQGMTDGTLPSPPVGTNDLAYVVYWPASSILDASSAGAGVMCLRASLHSAPGPFTRGYHESFVAPNGTRVPYAVVGDCGEGDAAVTTTASREIIGMATNPYEVEASGFLLSPQPTDPWLMDVDTGEVGYLCEREPPVVENGLSLHRSWSNAAAAAGRQPCVPAPADEPYYNVSASPAAMVSATPGSTVSFTLTGWSTAPVDDWKLAVERPDGADLPLASLDPVVSRPTLNNGVTAVLTITVPADARRSQYGALNVLSGDRGRVWPVGYVVE